MVINRQYKHVNRSLYKPRKKQHERANNKYELAAWNLLKFNDIKTEILKYDDQARLFAFGSRINGDFDDNSDFDCVVDSRNLSAHAAIKNIKIEGITIDLRFGTVNGNQYIEI